MIVCEEALQRLWDFLDGELEAADELEVQKHLEVCGRCYPQYDFRRAYFGLMHRIRTRDHVPPGLRRRIFERILAEESGSGNGNRIETDT